MNQVNKKDGFVDVKAKCTAEEKGSKFGARLRGMVEAMRIDQLQHASSLTNYIIINYTQLAENHLSQGAIEHGMTAKELGEFYVYFFKKAEALTDEMDAN